MKQAGGGPSLHPFKPFQNLIFTHLLKEKCHPCAENAPGALQQYAEGELTAGQVG
jgi:hypothetical protein